MELTGGYGLMEEPFEGIFGSNSELKILDFLLPRDDMEFNIQELADRAGIKWPTASKVIKKFIKHGILKEAQKHGNITYYTLNKDSKYVAVLEELNNLVIEDMLGDEMLYQIYDYWQQHSTPEQIQQIKEQKSNVALEDRKRRTYYLTSTLEPQKAVLESSSDELWTYHYNPLRFNGAF